MRWFFLLACASALAACPPPPPPADAGVDAGTPNTLEHCLDAPDTIVRQPSGELPCDLLPPGFKVER